VHQGTASFWLVSLTEKEYHKPKRLQEFSGRVSLKKMQDILDQMV
jgi:hypothetical protein